MGRLTYFSYGELLLAPCFLLICSLTTYLYIYILTLRFLGKRVYDNLKFGKWFSYWPVWRRDHWHAKLLLLVIMGGSTTWRVSFRFQSSNLVTSDIINYVLTSLRHNQFSQKEYEDCNEHLTHLLEACDTINPPDVSESDKRLMLFGYSLTCQAKERLKTISSDTITTWDELKRQFLDSLFPTTKYLDKNQEITSFSQENGESLYDTWERSNYFSIVVLLMGKTLLKDADDGSFNISR